MNNLINKVLMVLAASALFAGSAHAAMKTVGKSLSKGQTALAKIQQYGPSSFEIYTEKNRKMDLNAIKAELPKNADSEFKILKAATLEMDQAKRNNFFKTNGAALKAAGVLSAEITDNNLKTVVEEFKANPTAEKAAEVSAQVEVAKVVINNNDESAEGYKKYMTKKNALYGTIGIAVTLVAAYVAMNGVPVVLKPYVSPVTSKISTISGYLYGKLSAGAEALGLGESGYIGSRARAVAQAAQGALITGATSLGATSLLRRAGLMADTAQADAQQAVVTAANAAKEAELAKQAAAEAARQAALDQTVSASYR